MSSKWKELKRKVVPSLSVCAEKKCFCWHFLSEAGPWSLRWRLLLWPPQQVPEQPHGWPALPSWWSTERRQRRRCCELHAIPERDDRSVEKKRSRPERYIFTQMFFTKQKTQQILFGTILNCPFKSKTQLTQTQHKENQCPLIHGVTFLIGIGVNHLLNCIPCFLTGIRPSKRLCSTPVWYSAVFTGLSLVELSLVHCEASFEFWPFLTRIFSLLLDPSITTSPQTEELFDLIASSQSRRLDDQRVNVGNLPGLRITHNNLGHLVGEGDHQEPSDDFFNMLIKCQVKPRFTYDILHMSDGLLGLLCREYSKYQTCILWCFVWILVSLWLQSSRIDDQRCSPPEAGPHAPTVPDEDFFSLIQRVQAKRMDEQRVQLPTDDQDDSESPDSEPPGGFSS